MTYLDIEIRPIEEKDIPSVLEIENLCFVAPWKKEDFLYEIIENPYSNFWVIELTDPTNKSKSVVGFSNYWKTFDSATITQIAIHPYLQRHQLGSALMDEIINDCYAKRVRTLTLEVRISNIKAINFYKKHGFIEALLKKNYYSNGEDALYMTLEVEKAYGHDTSNRI